MQVRFSHDFPPSLGGERSDPPPASVQAKRTGRGVGEWLFTLARTVDSSPAAKREFTTEATETTEKNASALLCGLCGLCGESPLGLRPPGRGGSRAPTRGAPTPGAGHPQRVSLFQVLGTPRGAPTPGAGHPQGVPLRFGAAEKPAINQGPARHGQQTQEGFFWPECHRVAEHPRAGADKNCGSEGISPTYRPQPL